MEKLKERLGLVQVRSIHIGCRWRRVARKDLYSPSFSSFSPGLRSRSPLLCFYLSYLVQLRGHPDTVGEGRAQRATRIEPYAYARIELSLLYPL
jgi:hypothetical protein